MAVIQTEAAYTTPIAPDPGLYARSVTVSGSPAIALVIGSPGALTTEGTAASHIRQTAPAIAVAIGNPGTLTTAGFPARLTRLGGRLLNTGVLGGALVGSGGACWPRS